MTRPKFVLFSGQGAQKVGMGASLVRDYSEARECFAKADTILGVSLSKICFEGPEEKLTETRCCQPALYVVGYALFLILKNKGFLENLQYVLGLSLGELTALAVANVFDFESGLRLVHTRAQLMQEACEKTEGGMLSLIGGDIRTVEDLCQKYDIDISNRNCPGQIVVAGPKKILLEVEKMAKTMGFKMVIPLKVAGAYHSHLMRSAQEAFSKELDNYSFSTPTYTVISNTTGRPVKQPEEIKTALSKQIASTVLWEQSLFKLAEGKAFNGFECGPGGILAGLAKRTHKDFKVKTLCESADIQSIDNG